MNSDASDAFQILDPEEAIATLCALAAWAAVFVDYL